MESALQPDYGLEFLLAFDGRVHHLEEGYWMKFEINRVDPDPRRPHGLSYSFTLHAPDGRRLIGFDNAHKPPRIGAPVRRPLSNDHWHRSETDPGGRYRFKDAETLVDDFFNAVERVLAERGISTVVVKVDEKRKSR